jgi:hypothetical protein
MKHKRIPKIELIIEKIFILRNITPQTRAHEVRPSEAKVLCLVTF